jgi:hypothetical protein
LLIKENILEEIKHLNYKDLLNLKNHINKEINLRPEHNIQNNEELRKIVVTKILSAMTYEIISDLNSIVILKDNLNNIIDNQIMPLLSNQSFKTAKKVKIQTYIEYVCKRLSFISKGKHDENHFYAMFKRMIFVNDSTEYKHYISTTKILESDEDFVSSLKSISKKDLNAFMVYTNQTEILKITI